MKSPCVAACKNNGGICSGCHRTMDEISQWRHLSDEQRDSAMNALAGKEATHQCPSCDSNTVCDISLGKDTCWCFELEERDTTTLQKSNTCLCRKCLSKLPIA